MHADDVLLGDRRDVGHPLLHVAQHRMRDAAVAVGERDHHRRDDEHDERELPRDDEQQHADGDDREHVLEEEDQPVAEEEPDGLEVDGRARHQLAGLLAVEVAEREPDELRVDRVPQVELDAERDPPGDEPPAERGQRLRDPDHEHDPDQEPHLAVVVVADRVDDVAGEPRDRERAELRGDREDARQPHSAPCRARGSA